MAGLTTPQLKYRFNLITVAAGRKWKTAFSIEKRLFKHTLMTFGLPNTTPTFLEMIDESFKHDAGCVWYMHDILIYAVEKAAEHEVYVHNILE